jgi:hypothetical protein
VKGPGSGSESLLNVEWRWKPPVLNADCRYGGLGLFAGFGGNRSNFLADESHDTVGEGRSVKRSLVSVTYALWEIACGNNGLNSRHLSGRGGIN